jgi:hypothetical protein
MRNLTSAGAAALATTNSNVWMLSDRLSAPRMAAALLLSIAIMVGWLIVRYDLWEPADEQEEGILPADRKRAALFNAATVLTGAMAIGVSRRASPPAAPRCRRALRAWGSRGGRRG